ncbi:hypothetical protein Syun_009677 [Stephania yunnanensis]|uniref:Ataxin-2 C-terminal domain-containing protein n=1 Tax=Stephania yunnanensis TaxID=152371 RepID=A0AAP0KGK6_9MAGN
MSLLSALSPIPALSISPLTDRSTARLSPLLDVLLTAPITASRSLACIGRSLVRSLSLSLDLSHRSPKLPGSCPFSPMDKSERDMRDLEELLSKLNPMAEEFVPPSLVSHGSQAGFFANNFTMLSNGNGIANGNTGRRKRNPFSVSDPISDDVFRDGTHFVSVPFLNPIRDGIFANQKRKFRF